MSTNQLATRNSQLAPSHLFIIAWVLTMISIPILRWVVGDAVLHIGVMAGVILQASAVLAILQSNWGVWRVVSIVLLVVPLTWLIEYVGSNTGIPFGVYHYTDVLQPQVGGVPAIIPLAWLMMLPPSWAVATAILQSDKVVKWQSGRVAPMQSAIRSPQFAILSGLALTAWDFFLDPQMVGWGYWIWDQPGGYFGIPWVNFLGWWLSGTLVTLAIMGLIRPQSLPVRPLLLIYAITWALQSIGQAIFWGQPGPAAVGFVAMGGLLLVSLHRLLRDY